MTKEEFTKLKPEDTQFIKTVARLFSEFCMRRKGADLDRFLVSPLGKYLWKINYFIGDIIQNLEDIKLVETLIAGYEPGNLPLKKNSNGAHMIQYHYENYLLRTTKLKDLSLGLINIVMRLELRNGSNLESQILKRLDPQYGQFHIIWGQMNQLTNQVKPYRNHLAHNGSVRHKELRLLRVHYAHELTHQNTIDEFRYEAAMTGLQRELIQKFTAQTSVYIIASEQVLTMIYLYLAKPFLDNVGILVEEHYNKKNVE